MTAEQPPAAGRAAPAEGTPGAIFRQAARFGIVGIAATVTHVAIAWCANHLAGLVPYLANSLGFGIAFAVSYLGHFYWTFRRRDGHLKAQVRFAVVAGTGFALNNVIIWVTVDRLGLSFDLALVLIVLLVPPATWLLSRLWAFR